MTRPLRIILLLLLILVAACGLLVYWLSWEPLPRAKVPVACSVDAPVLAPGQNLKVMTWNVQYLAGKRYVFWDDQAKGNDERPTAQDLAYNLDEVARVIRDEAPDLVLLQELDDNARATDHQDQLALLQERLADLFPCSAQAFTWKSRFVPQWHILGSVGRKLATLSRYKLDKAERLQMAQVPGQWPGAAWHPKRALLSVYLPLAGGGQVAVLNTLLDSFGRGQTTQLEQLRAVAQRLDRLEGAGTPWIIGGDFNLLPLGDYRRLDAEQRGAYSADSDLHLLWDKYAMIPSNAEAGGADRARWLTHFPNDPRLTGPDRTVDYLFHSSRLRRVEARVRQDDTLAISNHLPVVATLSLPGS
jgi:endonuclease/exonuclease/phosphatase family metal-dependent hydrolase